MGNRISLAKLASNVLTIAVVAAIMTASILDGEMSWWKGFGWLLVWVAVAVTCLRGKER